MQTLASVQPDGSDETKSVSYHTLMDLILIVTSVVGNGAPMKPMLPLPQLLKRRLEGFCDTEMIELTPSAVRKDRERLKRLNSP